MDYLSKVIEDENIKLDFKPRAIISVGENLYEFQREKCEKNFKTNMYNLYGSIEFQTIATECKYKNGLHVFEDLFNVETDKKDNLVITRYDSSSTPFIRYQIGDCGKLTFEKCKCGKKGLKIKKIKGRIDEYLLLPKNKRLYPHPITRKIGQINQKYEGVILEFKIIQKSRKNIIFNLILKKKNNLSKKDLEKALKKFFPKEMNIQFKYPEKIKRKNKFILIEKEFKE